jgi:hypothetical protein
MNKNQLSQRLKSQHQQFTDYINGLSEQEFTSAPIGKWTPGQQLDHLVRSVAPLNKVMQARVIVESLGRAEQPSRNYDDLVAFYQSALAKGGKASGKFLPEEVPADQREKLIDTLLQAITTLTELLNNYSEEDLEKLVIPHPLLGNLTMREMMYFTIYHVQHHELGVKKGLA